MQDSIKDLAKALGNSSSNVQTKNVKSDEDSRKYISLWKDIGAQNLLFIPGGTMHPMLFLKKLERYFEDAGVPDKAKVGLAINCLRSSAADWVANKEASFSSYDIFKDMFKKRYWGEDEERQLFYSIKYGVYNGGNKADYILKLASQASFLSQEIKEKDLVEMLLGHFGNDIQRGAVLSGVKCIDDLEEYMRKIDSIENNNDRRRRQEDNGRDRARNREEEGNRRYVRGQEQGREPNREVRSIMRFNTTWEDLLSDDEKEVESDGDHFKSPMFSARIQGKLVNVLIDSGSQVSAVSEKLIKHFSGQNDEVLPVLPVSNVSISVAIGAKSLKIKEQVLLPIEIDGKVVEVICLVVPNLNQDVILGCDWLISEKVRMDFDKMSVYIPELNMLLKCRYEGNEGQTLSINLLNTVSEKLEPARHMYSEAEVAKVVEISGRLNEKDKPGRLVFLDLMGPLPRSVAGVVYLLAVVDGFTRYVMLYGLKKANARSVINRLKNDYFVKMGIPERILSDNATIFHAKLWKRELEGLSIKVSHTSVYFPEGNITERVNREIGRMLRAFCYEKHTKWAQYLGQIESCLNEVVHESTGFSPKFLHFGIQTNSRMCEFINPPPNSDARQELTSMWVLAHKKLMTKAERKRTKRQGGLEVVFKEGDAVLVRQHPLSSAEDSIIKKFCLLYEGPFWVSKVINPNCYEVTDSNGLFAGRHNVKT
nr:unnamed protein product [Callosobruchus analis]